MLPCSGRTNVGKAPEANARPGARSAPGAAASRGQAGSPRATEISRKFKCLIKKSGRRRPSGGRRRDQAAYPNAGVNSPVDAGMPECRAGLLRSGYAQALAFRAGQVPEVPRVWRTLIPVPGAILVAFLAAARGVLAAARLPEGASQAPTADWGQAPLRAPARGGPAPPRPGAAAATSSASPDAPREARPAGRESRFAPEPAVHRDAACAFARVGMRSGCGGMKASGSCGSGPLYPAYR